MMMLGWGMNLIQGYWASYNIPYIREIYEKSGYLTQPASPDIDYYNCSRHNIFKRDAVSGEEGVVRQPHVNTLEEFKHVLRSNQYLTDPLAEKNPKHVQMDPEL